jgi:hypothetical protein
MLKLTWLMFGGAWCVDGNAPYRLMKTDRLDEAILEIPQIFFLKKVVLAVILKRKNERS